ncbi:MAG: DNA repair protein RadA [Candidatus Fraserbacteria bacterium RBG_16_55_9]|uniref:DNA repair protein RadA n=1 Tax=Fraserbacteria sp. (strain RBG_16_55_9) TaxID=1817864 RepID=A0A1F5UYF5_FRAXR|nr:MAG: DNA repair protein RadA [Candidatus Fraserbacteria bacterium RBG_16_55_9]
MLYRCRGCGYQSLKWLGRCPECGQWESFSELPSDQAGDSSPRGAPQSIVEISLEASGRWPTGISEFDRILGGGVLIGSTVLIGGEPGIGKSTLMLEVAGRLAQGSTSPVLYVSGEEAPAQIKLRARRLGLDSAKNLWVLNEQRLSAICAAAREAKAATLIVDSIQTVFSSSMKEGLGTTQQVGEAAFHLSQLAKSEKIPIYLIGHITKSGEFAGPKAIEHLVDVALYLEGGRDSDIRILRAVKNRYGSTEEIGVFQMSEGGLREISNPSAFFTERTGEPKPGAAIVPSLEGTRPILVEIQALVTSTRATMPQRRATGLDYNRVALLLAVVEKRLGLHITQDDVYLNVAGGLALREPAIDLGIVAAVVSSYKDRAIDSDTVVMGELGLLGELRKVRKLKERLNEAAKLGYRRAVVPASERLEGLGLEVRSATGIEEAIGQLGL